MATTEIPCDKVLEEVEGFRFDRTLRSVNQDDPFELIRIAPPWLLQLPVTALVLPTRCNNVLEDKSIQRVGDLLTYQLEEAKRWRKFGKKSARDLSLALQKAIEQGPQYFDKATADQTRSWFDEMAHELPSLIEELALRGILSASTYSTYIARKDLPYDAVLEEVEGFRFASMLPSINQDDPFELASIAPSWLLGLSVTKLGLPARCNNVLDRKKIQTVGDLLRYRSDEAKRWKNFGKKSARDLLLGLHSVIALGAQHFELVCALEQLSATECSDSRKGVSALHIGDFPETDGALTLNEMLVLCETSLSAREAAIIQGRFMSSPRQTLGQIGYQLGLTRERVRQLEKQCLALLNERHLFPKLISLRIARLVNGRKTPLYVDRIHEEDSWFGGFSNELGRLGAVIRAFSEWSTLECGGRFIVSRIEPIEFDELKRKALESLRETKPMVLKRSEVETMLSQLAIAAGSPELGSVLLAALEYQLHFTQPTGEAEPLLAGVGLGVKHTVIALLNESEEPLHFRELTNLCSVRLGREVDERRVHSVLITDNAQYYGRGTYGTTKHFPLSEDLKHEVRTELEQIVLAGPAGRQWHASELLDRLSDRLPDLPEAVDKYIVNIILDSSRRLESLGRFVWVGAAGTSEMGERLELGALISDILSRVGHPMRAESIRSEISKQRGTGDFFLINATKEVARVRPGVWGLVERDFFATDFERCQMLDALHAVLTARREGLHESELIESLVSLGLRVPGELTDYMLMSLAQTDERFNLHRGGIMALAEWRAPRRLTVRQAFEHFLSDMETSYAMQEIVKCIEETVGRTVGKQELYALFNQYDVFYHSATATYRKATKDDLRVEVPDDFSEDTVEALYRALIPPTPSNP